MPATEFDEWLAYFQIKSEEDVRNAEHEKQRIKTTEALNAKVNPHG